MIFTTKAPLSHITLAFYIVTFNKMTFITMKVIKMPYTTTPFTTLAIIITASIKSFKSENFGRILLCVRRKGIALFAILLNVAAPF